MTACLALCLWALSSSSLLLCTLASGHSTHTASGYPSNYEVPKHRGVYRGALTEDQGVNFYYDLEAGRGQGDDLQKVARFESSDLSLKPWPVREGESRQHYINEDSGPPRFKDSPLSIYDDEDEDDILNPSDLLESNADVDPQKNKRESHSLSIVNPLDVLRQRLMLDLATRKMKQNQEQIKANDVILKNLGKRSVSGHPGRTGLTSLSRHQDSTGNFNV